MTNWINNKAVFMSELWRADTVQAQLEFCKKNSDAISVGQYLNSCGVNGYVCSAALYQTELWYQSNPV